MRKFLAVLTFSLLIEVSAYGAHNDSLSDLGTSGGASSYAAAINDSGTAVANALTIPLSLAHPPACNRETSITGSS